MIENAISKKTRCIFIPHTVGIPANMDQIIRIVKKYNLFLLEDGCDCLGAKWDNKLMGTFGEMSSISFYPAHHMTMGEGGMVVVNNRFMKKTALSIRDWGRDCWCPPGEYNTCGKRFEWKLGDLPYGYDHKYIYSNLGYNLKATDMQAALGCSQIKKLNNFINIRRKNWEKLKKILSEEKIFKNNLNTVSPTPNTIPSWFGFAVICKKHINRSKLIKLLENNHIGTRLLFGGNITSQPAYKGLKYRISGDLKNSNIIKDRLFWIGVHPNINSSHINYIVKILEEGLKKQIN